MRYRTYEVNLPSTKPLVEGMSWDEFRKMKRHEEDRVDRGETQEITLEQFKEMTFAEVILGVPLPESTDEWLRNHCFTMGDRPSSITGG